MLNYEIGFLPNSNKFKSLIKTNLIKAVDLYPCTLDKFLEEKLRTIPIYLNLDFPMGTNSTEARLKLLELYSSTYPQVDGFNIGILNTDKVSQDIETIANFLYDNKLKCRFCLDTEILNDKTVEDFSQFLDQSSATGIILRDSILNDDIETLYDLLCSLMKNTTIPISIDGDFEDFDLKEFTAANSLILTPDNILSNLND